ncbi:MAG: hexitol phosphatase HxpB [Bdellovibrionales bacterium]|nr:hexitol phosphatase HxpB [Bdellovibrionales bacterium]
MDGLLIDSEPIWRVAEVAVFRSFGVPLTPELCATTMGMRIDEVILHWQQRYPDVFLDPAVVQERVLAAVMDGVTRTGEAMRGAEEALQFCRDRGYRLAVASSSPLQLIEHVLEHLGIRHYFSVVRSAESEPRGKPDPAVFLTTAKALGVEPSSCLVFEDSFHGAQAARRAGMKCILVPDSSLTAEERQGAQATMVLESLQEFPSVASQVLGVRHN